MKLQLTLMAVNLTLTLMEHLIGSGKTNANWLDVVFKDTNQCGIDFRILCLGKVGCT